MNWQESDNIIYMFRREGLLNKTLPDLTDVVIFKTENSFWAIGQKPKDFERWLKVFLGKKSVDMTRIYKKKCVRVGLLMRN